MSTLEIDYLRKMRTDWDERARLNAEHFIADGQESWTQEDFIASGEITVSQDILGDLGNICQGKDPLRVRVLELGCGIGRVTRALSRVFGQIQGVDVSPEMIRKAKLFLAGIPNVTVSEIDGATLAPLGMAKFDFAYSCCVFHHISSYDVIESLAREVGERLHPGSLFKFEVQGCEEVQSPRNDTWLGAPFSLDRAQHMADQTGFELRYHNGVGQERFWLWFFKK